MVRGKDAEHMFYNFLSHLEILQLTFAVQCSYPVQYSMYEYVRECTCEYLILAAKLTVVEIFASQCCGSKNPNKREGWKKICCHTFFCRQKFHKIEVILFLKKKIWPSFQNIIELFTQKFVTKL